MLSTTMKSYKNLHQALFTNLRNLSTATESTFQTRPYKLFKLDSGPNSEVQLTREDALNYYREMQLIRRMEAVCGNLYKEKKIRGFCHLSTGQEACAVGAVASLQSEDAVITSYRCHGWTYVMGGTVVEIISELTGRINGNVYGKGGSMHMYAKNFFGGNGIVGAQQPLGAGIALAMKYRKQKAVSLAIYGDGAANQGQLFEAMNMAKLWNIPCLFVCENNGFGMGTSAQRSSASTEYYTRGDYIPGLWVDGMDVLTVREAIRWAKEYCNAGHGPLVIEFATYRYVGHSVSDPGTSYRTRDEVAEVRKTRDPITHFKDRIITAGLTDEEELKEMEKSVRKEIDDAVKIATTEDVLPQDALYSDIYANTPPLKIRGTTLDTTVIQKYTTTFELLKDLGRNPRTY